MSTPQKMLVIDVEATCWKDRPPNMFEASKRQNEIIEIGITPIDITQTDQWGNIVPRLETSEAIIVLPTTTEISEFCTELTTLTPEFVKIHGMPFGDAIHKLRSKYRSDINLWASYGDYDRQAFERQCKNEGVPYPFNNNHVNVKALVGLRFGEHLGTGKACKKMGFPFEGTRHRGIDDSRNIAKILLGLTFGKLDNLQKTE